MQTYSREYLAGRLGFASVADIDEFITVLQRFERGEIDGEQWRKFRLVRGVYGQRQPGLQMLRVKIPQGVLTPPQLRALAEVSRKYTHDPSGGSVAPPVHVTTRQNLQFYGLRLDKVEAAMRLLADVGLTTREACGHSVRNITACALAGVGQHEIFDVTPYADALSRYLLRGPRSSTLPRKFKIAMEGCRQGCGVAPINDLAFFARLSPEGRRGFLVLCGGGTATLVRSGKVLHQFLPAGDLLLLSEAVLRVFHREGERKNKHKARLKWLIERIGFDEFARRVHAELATFSDAERQAAQLGFHPDAPPELPAPPPPRQAPELPLAVEEVGYAEWCADNVAPQRQPGYVAVQLRLPLGDLYPQQLDGLAALCERLGEGQVRTTTEQNVVLRFIPAGRTRALYHELRALGLHAGGAGFIGDVTSCPGADTCAIAVTASRGIGRELTEHLFARRDKQPGDPESLRDESSLLKTRIRVSGCPNGCGQHHVADIGFQGALRKVGGRALPAYHLYIGGGGDVRQAAAGKDGATAAPTARFGRVVGRLPARRGKAAVDRLIALWRRTRQGDETLSAFLAEVPLDTVQKELADLLVITEETAQPDDYVDLGQSAPFSVSDAEGECAA